MRLGSVTSVLLLFRVTSLADSPVESCYALESVKSLQPFVVAASLGSVASDPVARFVAWPLCFVAAESFDCRSL